jgi:hypothetical protein
LFIDKIAPFHRDLKDPETLKGWERKLKRDALDVERVPGGCPFCGGGSGCGNMNCPGRPKEKKYMSSRFIPSFFLGL